MKFFILILVSLSIQSVILADIGKVTLKAKQKNEYVGAKIHIKSPMHGKIEENARVYWGNEKSPIDFITNITIKSKHNTILDIETSSFLSENPLLKFKMKKDFPEGKIEFIFKNNNGDTKNKFKNIKNYSKNDIEEILIKSHSTNSLLSRINYPKIWKASTPEEAIIEIYGDTEMIENIIELEVSEISENSTHVPIRIKTNVDLESIIILTTNNPRSVISVIAIPFGKLIQFDTRIKFYSSVYIYKNKSSYNGYEINRKPNIIIVGKGRNGKVYKTSKQTRFTSCINSGGGIDNEYELYNLQLQE